jgi:hypothetical protein
MMDGGGCIQGRAWPRVSVSELLRELLGWSESGGTVIG